VSFEAQHGREGQAAQDLVTLHLVRIINDTYQVLIVFL